MANYKLSENADDDLYRIWLYGMERWGIDRADQYIESMYQRFSEIAEQPLRYPSVNDIRVGYRRCLHGQDSIFYRVNGADVEIMAIIGQQDLNQWL